MISVLPLLTVPTMMLALWGSVRVGTVTVAEMNQKIAATKAKITAPPFVMISNLGEKFTFGFLISNGDPNSLTPSYPSKLPIPFPD